MSNIDIRTLDLETDQLDNKITILEAAEVGLNKNSSNQNYSIRMRPNSTTLLHCGAFATQGTSLKDLKASDRVSTYDGARTIFNRFSSTGSYILSAHNASFERKALNQFAFTNCFPPYPDSSKLVLDTMDVFKAAAAISPSTFDFYNAETGKHTVSMSYLCKTLLNKEETHKAYDDVIDTNHCLQKVFQQIPEIQGLIEYVSDNDNRDILFESPLLMRLSLSSINGPYSQIISWLTDYEEWGGWGITLMFPDNFEWEDDVNQLVDELRRKVKVSITKKKRVALLFPLKSKTFKKFYPNYPEDKIAKVMELIRNDNAFIQDKVAEIKKRYSSKDTPKFMDIFNKNDNFPSHNDRHISSFFHKADPKTKMDLCEQFEDKRLSMNSKIIMLHNFKDFMPSKAINDTLEYEVSELEKPEASRVTFEAFLKSYDEVCSDQKWSKNVIENLKEYKAHVLALRANPKLFLEG